MDNNYKLEKLLNEDTFANIRNRKDIVSLLRDCLNHMRATLYINSVDLLNENENFWDNFCGVLLLLSHIKKLEIIDCKCSNYAGKLIIKTISKFENLVEFCFSSKT